MKKKIVIIFAILLLVTLVFTMVACKKKKTEETPSTGLSGVTEEQISKVGDKIQSFIDTWAANNKTETKEDQKTVLASALKAQKSQFKLTGDTESYTPTFVVKYADGTYTVEASWNQGALKKTFTTQAQTIPYTNWAGKASRTSGYDYIDGKASDTLDAMVAAFVNTANKVTANAPTGKFGLNGTVGFDAFGKSYGLQVKGNVDVKNKTSNELGLMIVNKSNEEIAGLYYKAADTVRGSRIYIQYNTDDGVAYKYIEYADILGFIEKAIPDSARDKDGNIQYGKKDGAFTFEDEEEITGLSDLLSEYGITIGSMINGVINLAAKSYQKGDRYLVDINLAEVMSNISSIISGLGEVDLDFLTKLGLNLSTMHGLYGHISLSARIVNDELVDVELAVNIPKCTFYFTDDESGKKLEIPSIGFAIYLENFSFLTDGTVANVIPAKAITEAKYFSPTNVDLSGDVYINHVEGAKQGLNSTFHFDFVTDINPLEIVENGAASTARAALVIKQSQGETYNPETATNFLTISYEQAPQLLCVSGTAFNLDDGGEQVYTLRMDGRKFNIPNSDDDILGDIRMWLGLTNWIGITVDPEKGIVIDPDKANGPAKESAQAIFGNKLTQALMEYFMTKYSEYKDAHPESAEVAEANPLDEIGGYFNAFKELYDSFITDGVIKFTSDPEFSLSVNADEAAIAKIITAINSTFGADIKMDKVEDLKIVKVELNSEGYADKLYVKVGYGKNVYELTFDNSVAKNFTITFVMTTDKNRSYTFSFNAKKGVETDSATKWTATVIFDIKDATGASVNKTTIILSDFHGEWGNDNRSEVEYLIPTDAQKAAAQPIFPTDGTGPATKFAEGLLNLLSSDSAFAAAEKIGQFIIRQIDFSKINIAA